MNINEIHELSFIKSKVVHLLITMQKMKSNGNESININELIKMLKLIV